MLVPNTDPDLDLIKQAKQAAGRARRSLPTGRGWSVAHLGFFNVKASFAVYSLYFRASENHG
jgi:hypothetical protein